MTQAAWPDVFYGTGHPQRSGNRSALACPQGIFATSDGFVAIAVDTDAQWQRLVRMVGNDGLQTDPSLATTEGRLASEERIEQALSAWVAGREAEQVAVDCQAAGVPAAPVRNLSDIVEDQDVLRRRLIIEVEHPIAGKMKILGNPLQLSRTPAVISACAPVLGAHTRDVLDDWLGLSGEQVAALNAAGTVLVHSGVETRTSDRTTA